jgi:phosphoglycolate phosphatase-like HAD superfamily hydrolase
MIKVLVLDFDGLLVESEEIKDTAFVEVFAAYPEHRKAIRRYVVSNRRVGRYVKFRHIAETLLGLPYTEADAKRIAADFSAYTRSRIIACPYVRGAPEFLACFDGRLPMYLASATPHDELVPIVDARGLARYFKRLFGAPAKKADVLREVMRAEGAAAAETLLVGDSLADLESAREVGAAFVGRNREDDFSTHDVPRFDDLVGIRTYVAARIGARDKGNV